MWIIQSIGLNERYSLIVNWSETACNKSATQVIDFTIIDFWILIIIIGCIVIPVFVIFCQKFCHLLIKFFQTCMSFFLLLNTKEDILKNAGNQTVCDSLLTLKIISGN